METFFNRYLSGEYVQVWNEIRSLGAQIQLDQYRSDIVRVAHETMGRAQKNLSNIAARLESLGYEFTASAIELPKESAGALVQKLDSDLSGALPLSLKAWYAHVGAVDFRGSHPLLCQVARDGDTTEPTVLSDPIVVAPIEALLEGVSDWKLGLWGDQPLKLELSPDDLHKANVSGGSYDIIPTTSCADSVFLDWHSFYFVDYLRCVFEWGGFPGWERYPDRPEEQLAFLRKSLAPI